MNFSGIPYKSIFGKIARFPLKLLPPNLQIPILQGKLKGKKWIVGSSNHGCWLGSYEYEKQLLFEKAIKPGSVVFDLGANVGFYTLLSSTLVGKTGKVVAFEPVPRNLLYLKKHLLINNIKNVQIFEVAVSDKTGETNFDESFNPSVGKISKTGNLRVKTVVLDELFKQEQIPLPNYIKIDIEGGELSALLGAKTVINLAKPTIFLATHGNEIKNNCLNLLNKLEYDIISINKDMDFEKSDEFLAFSKKSI